MIRGLFYSVNRSFENLKNVIFHVKLLSPTLRKSLMKTVQVHLIIWTILVRFSMFLQVGSKVNVHDIYKVQRIHFLSFLTRVDSVIKVFSSRDFKKKINQERNLHR